MTEQQQNEFRSEFQPEAMVQSLREDTGLQNKAKNFALLKTATFLAFSSGPGRVAILNSTRKEALVPAFTCREEMDKWPFQRGPVREVPFAELEQLVHRNDRLDGVVINPFGKALFLRRSQLGDMESTLRAANPAKDVQMKATRDYPMGLPIAVRELMEQRPEVYRVWLLAAHAQGDTRDHKLFVVDFDGKPDSLFPQLAQAVKLYMRQGEGFEMRKADIGLLRAAERAAKPIYEKE